MNEPIVTAQPPYYAVIFTSVRTAHDPEGYERTAARMVELAAQQPGFLAFESARGPDGLGITISYWTDLQAVRRWKEHAEHLVAQRRGKDEWYQEYHLRVCRVEAASDFQRTQEPTGP